MKATQVLMQEHAVILRVLAALEKQSARAESQPAARPGFFIEAADFIHGFADGCHHRKEEGVLFVAMNATRLPKVDRPIAVMLAEHEMGRGFTIGMRQAAEKWQAGDSEARLEAVRNAREYVALLRHHIRKENDILFPLADRIIRPEHQSQVEADFERMEQEETGAGVHAKFEALAETLEKESA